LKEESIEKVNNSKLVWSGAVETFLVIVNWKLSTALEKRSQDDLLMF